jgi:NADPH:quinone reductase-like Zn-dependent oxidoreductase
VPRGLDPVTSASLVLNYLTAFQMLHRAARMKRGERILVHGAAGGVGTALLQLGGLAGLERYGTASAGKHDLVRKLGGIPIDYRNEDFVARIRVLTRDGVDAVFDAIGGTHLLRSHRALRRGGRLVLYGVSAALRGGGSKLLLTLGLLLALKAIPDGRRAMLSGVSPGAPTFLEDLSTLLALAAEGKIAPIVAERMPLEAAARAHELLERGAVEGKLVLVP